MPQFLNRLAASKPDLMLTVTTPMTQSARQILANRSFPIVFAPVTDPVAAKLVPSWDKGDALMTGASNLPDFDATCDFIKTLVPNAKRLGILYNPGDDSDVTFVSHLERTAPKHSLELVKVGIDNANDIPTRIQSLQGRADALFIPASSLLQPAGAAIAAASNRIKIPVFNSNTAQIRTHQMLAAYSVDWKKVGSNAGVGGRRDPQGQVAGRGAGAPAETCGPPDRDQRPAPEGPGPVAAGVAEGLQLRGRLNARRWSN